MISEIYSKLYPLQLTLFALGIKANHSPRHTLPSTFLYWSRSQEVRECHSIPRGYLNLTFVTYSLSYYVLFFHSSMNLSEMRMMEHNFYIPCSTWFKPLKIASTPSISMQRNNCWETWIPPSNQVIFLKCFCHDSATRKDP